jgi:hypothetical protein
MGAAEARVTDWHPAERPRSVCETLQGRIVALVRAGTCPQVAAAARRDYRRTDYGRQLGGRLALMLA